MQKEIVPGDVVEEAVAAEVTTNESAHDESKPREFVLEAPSDWHTDVRYEMQDWGQGWGRLVN